MTIAVDMGRKAAKTNKESKKFIWCGLTFANRLDSKHLTLEKDNFGKQLVDNNNPNPYLIHNDKKNYSPWNARFFKIELLLEISNNVVCATCKGSDQPVHMRSLIRAVASCLNIL